MLGHMANGEHVSVMASPGGTAHTVIWRALAAVDVMVVAVFAVTAATEPYGVLEQEGVEIHNFQGLLPTVVVVALRSAVLAAERRLLPAARGRRLVFTARIVSLIGFYYGARWLFEQAYGRWQEVVLGGTVGYALVGVAGIGLAVLIHGLTSIRQGSPVSAVPPRGEPTRAAASPAQVTPGTALPPSAAVQAGPAPAGQRLEVARESLFGLVGVFLGIAGLVMNVTSVARIAAAILIAGAAVACIALFLRGQTGGRAGAGP